MRSRLSSLSLGAVNLALLSVYFFPLWGRAAVRALISPYSGLEDRALAAAAIDLRRLFDLGSIDLIADVLAGIKLVVAMAFACYLIEFARSVAMRRATDRDTIDVVLILAVVGVVLSVLSALALGDAASIRLAATQALMVAGAVIIVAVERQIAVEPRTSRVATAARERERTLGLPAGSVSMEPPPGPAAAAVARIPEVRLRPALARS